MNLLSTGRVHLAPARSRSRELLVAPRRGCLPSSLVPGLVAVRSVLPNRVRWPLQIATVALFLQHQLGLVFSAFPVQPGPPVASDSVRSLLPEVK
jgi:hypothetical protein